MSINWDSLIGDHFKNKNKINFGTILEMVSQQMEASPILKEGKKGKTASTKGEQFLLSLPKFTPSEAWGRPNSEARIEIERFFKRVGGRGLKGKLDWIARIQQPPGKNPPHVQRVITTLVILESLASCVNDFSEPSAGFVFEGFLAALLGGRQVADPVEGNLPIEDIIAFELEEGGGGGVPMSLKLLRGGKKGKGGAETGGGAIKGSYTNLIDAMNKYPRMVYVVAYKKGGGGKTGALTIGEFEITRENIVEIVNHRNSDLLKVDTGTDYKLTPDLLIGMAREGRWEELYPILQRTAGYSRTPQEVEPDPEEDPETIQEGLYPLVHIPRPFMLTEGKTDIQWHLTQADLTKGEWGAWKELAVLDIDPENLKGVVEQYSDVLKDEIMTLFETVKDLSENINSYYIYENRKAGIQRGQEAVGNAEDIKTQTSKQVAAEASDTNSP